MSDKIKKTDYLLHVTHYITCWLVSWLRRYKKEDKDEIQKPEKISIAYCAKKRRERKNKKYNYSLFILEKKEEFC